MKLNKPPFTQEQSILEEYVEFLLTDLSNVHPLKVEPKKKISDLVTDNSQRLNSPSKQGGKSKLSTGKTSVKTKRKSAEKQNIDQQNTDCLKENAASDKEEPPKWSTIEVAASKRDEKVQSNRQSEQKATEEVVAKSVVTSPIKEPKPGLSEQPNSAYVEESEEEQLKQWDALITAEKEHEILASESQPLEGETEQDTKPEIDTNKKTQTASLSNASQTSSLNIKENQPEESDLSRQTREIIDSYLPSDIERDPRLASVEKLLSRISLATLPKVKPGVESKLTRSQDPNKELAQAINAQQVAETAQATFLHREAKRSRDFLPEVFQTLIFQVAKLPLAVPLIKLGGIIKITDEDITPLVGTPSWFMGLVPNDRGNLMVVDTQRYLMPEKGTAGDREEYQYLIVLDNSNWALACNSVGDAKNLTQDDVRWAQKSSRRPWFAGMVVDYMSALLEVDELINMLADNIVE